MNVWTNYEPEGREFESLRARHVIINSRPFCHEFDRSASPGDRTRNSRPEDCRVSFDLPDSPLFPEPLRPHLDRLAPGEASVGVRIAAGLLADPQRLSWAAGTIPAREVFPPEARFRADAYVPNGPWHNISSADLSPSAGGSHVVVARFREDVASEANRLIDSGGLTQALELLAAEVNRQFDSRGRVVCDGLEVSKPGLKTVTADLDRFALIGLHFDEWDRLPVAQRAGSRLRLGINLGPGYRYFAFLPIAAARIAALSEAAHDKPASVEALGKAFLKSYPGFPVLRVRIEPNEMYLAPTENILHDASTEGILLPSRCVAFRGHLSPARAPHQPEARLGRS